MDNWRKKRHTYIYIDEIMTIFRNPYAAQYFASLWQRIRKRGGYIIGATQNTTEILNSPEARKLLEKQLHHHDAVSVCTGQRRTCGNV